MSDCIFCKIGAHELEAIVVYEDSEFIAFRDRNPQAPVHLLVIPKQHSASLDEYTTEHAGLLGRLLLAATHVARQERIAARGYRLILNTGEEGGQTVGHVHLHLLGGRALQWPPG